VTDLPNTGDPPVDLTPRVPVAAVCKRLGIEPTFYWAEARAGRAPVSHKGLTIEQANAWIAERLKKKAARAEASRRRQALLAAQRLRKAAKAAKAGV
jgi:hypothetical protein